MNKKKKREGEKIAQGRRPALNWLPLEKQLVPNINNGATSSNVPSPRDCIVHQTASRDANEVAWPVSFLSSSSLVP